MPTKHVAVKRLRGRRVQARNSRELKQWPLCKMCTTEGVICAHRKDGKRCVRASQEIDHIVPLAKGGKDVKSNRQGLCKACHKLKTREEFNPRPRIATDGYPCME